MHIDHQTFERSFFYIGPGFDIQPLLRFTHLCDTFLYPNLYLDRRPVEGWYDEALANATDIEVLGKQVTSGFDADIALEHAPDRRASLDHAFSMTPHEFMDFSRAFPDARNHERYSITWRLRRRSTGRLLTLHFFTFEGLEAYAALSQLGRYAPRVLCTIETRVLEAPRGIFNRFFSVAERAQPLLWVRGFQPTGSGNDFGVRRDTLDSVGVLPDAVIHLVPWCLEVAQSPIMPILDRVNVASSDDSRRFLDTTRLDAIDRVLREAQSQWTLTASGPLFRLYARAGSPTADHPVLVSSHADSTYAKHFHEPLEDSVELLGTFDNSITNALVLELMLADHLPENALVAFTGDEENESRGAAEVIAHLRGVGRLPRAVIVLDITDDRSYGSPCTLENYFANGTLGLPTSEHEFLNLLQGAFDRHVPSVHHDDAWPDESWRYEEEGVHVVSLCVPTIPANPGDHGADWMHSAAGIRIRADLLPAFGDSLARVARLLSERGSVTAAALETTC
jgi:hypothetical protein